MINIIILNSFIIKQNKTKNYKSYYIINYFFIKYKDRHQEVASLTQKFC